MRELLGLLWGFFPWILFAILSGPSEGRLSVAIIASLVTTVIFGYQQLRKKFILTWGSLIFFLLMIVLVVFLKNILVMKHMDLLAKLTLAIITWTSLLVDKPFILQYAREQAPETRWHLPSFIRTCKIMTVVWGLIFLFSAALSLWKLYYSGLNDGLFKIISFMPMIVGIIFSVWYPKKVRKTAAALTNDG